MIKEIKGKDFRKMQLTELDMLVEFDKVCRKYNINYVLFGGSLLGAVRHQGYIPWDDDADIGMLREDYETFKKHKDEMNPNICFFQDHDTDHEYRWEYGKLRRTGSTYVRVGQEHLKCKTGIFVDVFPMDDITGFLYLIGSVFAPMIAIQIADYFILHRDRRKTAFDTRNLVIWVIGFVLYRILMNVDLPVGNTLPDMVITVILCLIVEKAAGASHNRKRG